MGGADRIARAGAPALSARVAGDAIVLPFAPCCGRRWQRSCSSRSTAGSLQSGPTGTRRLASLVVILFAVVLPALWIGSAVVDEAAGLFVALRDGDIDVALYFEEVFDALPANMQASLAAPAGRPRRCPGTRDRFVQASLGIIAAQALAMGAAFSVSRCFAIALYVGFFLLRDGRAIGEILAALPMERGVADRLAERFLSSCARRSRDRSSSGLQGALGALTFLIVGIPSVLLLGVVMAIASLFPRSARDRMGARRDLPAGDRRDLAGRGGQSRGRADRHDRQHPAPDPRRTRHRHPDWLILVTTLGGIALIGLSGIVVGPLVCGLFLAAWGIFAEQRAAAAGGRAARISSVPRAPPSRCRARKIAPTISPVSSLSRSSTTAMSRAADSSSPSG